MAGNPFLDEILASEADKTAKERFAEKVAPKEFGYVDVVTKAIVTDLIDWGDRNGESRDVMEQVFEKINPQMWTAIQTDYWAVQRDNDDTTNRFLRINDAEDKQVFVRKPSYFQNTADGLNATIEWARNWMGGSVGIDLTAARKPGSGRSGPRKPTAQEIRNQYDVKQLANQVNEMNRGLVLEEHGDAMSVARQYVDAIVSSGGEKAIDFSTFVRSKIEKTSRYKSIYRQKPEHLSAEQHMAPYIQQAGGFARPDEAAEIAIGGAQFGASAQAFSERLKRTDSFTGSAPFINNLEGRMSDLNSVFKG